MLTIISERHPVTQFEYSREFDSVNYPGSGYSFPCDAEGNITFACKEAKENFDMAISHPEILTDRGVVKRKISYIEPAKGKCSCGNVIELIDEYLGACSCDKCNKWYNLFGQELLAPEFWEEDF